VLPEPSQQGVGLREVPLGLIVETCYRSNGADEVESELVEEKGTDKGDPDVAEEVLDVNILRVRGAGTFRISTSSTASSSTSSRCYTIVSSSLEASQDVGRLCCYR
jgi:hypothetical protein